MAVSRRIYLLPDELCARLRRYQADQQIASEVEAARQLFRLALDAHESARVWHATDTKIRTDPQMS